MNSLKSLILVIIAGILLTTCNQSDVEPEFLEVNEFVDPQSDAVLSDLLLNFSGNDPSARFSDQLFNEAIGQILTNRIVKRISSPDQLGPVYSMPVVKDPHDNIKEWLVLEATEDGYVGYIIQYEHEGSFDLLNFTGTARVLDLERTIQSEEYFENGVQTSLESENGRTETTYTNCDCEWVTKETDVIGPITGEVIGTDTEVWLNCHCDEVIDAGDSSTGGGDTGGIGTPIEGGSGPTGGGDGSSGGSGGTIGLPSECEGTSGFSGAGECYSSEEMALIQLLEQDPFALIENCDQIQNWQNLAQHTPPISVISKIQNLDDNYTSIITGDWDIQYIKDAKGPVVNLDYFPVRITQLPKNPANGQRFTPQGFFNYVRTNLDTFFENNSTEFGPYNATEEAIWNSPNYLGAIMRFEISPASGLSQDGSVICSNQQTQSWTFTTIESPKDWNHPVSGNREFGIQSNSDGSYTFFTRGVDRVAETFDNLIGNLPATQSAFEGADALWNAFQNNLELFINNPTNGGQAQKLSSKIDRPNWDKIRDVLEGKRPISDLGCN